MTDKYLFTCKCGNWYNTEVECPQCGTKAYVSDKKQ